MKKIFNILWSGVFLFVLNTNIYSNSQQKEEGLLLLFHFEEEEGNVITDASNNGNRGIIYGAKYVEGRFGKALQFDGVDDYVEVNKSKDWLWDKEESFTLELWVKAYASGPILTTYNPGPPSKEFFSLGIDRIGRLTFAFRDARGVGVDIRKAVNIKDGKWHHIVAVRDGKRRFVYLYLDGKLIARRKDPTIDRIYSKYPLTLGSESSRHINFFSGIIDEVRIYRKALQPGEIEEKKKIIQEQYSMELLPSFYFGTEMDGVIDRVKCGDLLSERKHQIEEKNSQVDRDRRGIPFRKVYKGGYFSYKMRVHQGKQNYLTLKFWAGKIRSGYRVMVNNQNIGDFLPRKIKENIAPYQEGFCYYTYMIPRDITDNNDTLVVKIAIDRELESFDIYEIYTHSTPNILLPAYEKKKRYPHSQVKSIDVDKVLDIVSRRVDEIVSDLRKWQLFGEKWEEMKINYQLSDRLDGALIPGEILKNQRLLEKKSQRIIRVLMGLDGMAYVYYNPRSKYYRNEEMLDRVIAGLDFLSRAQSASGGFEDERGTRGWIGGPHRKYGGGVLEGYLMSGAGMAFLRIFPEIKGRLDEDIDSDGDGKKDISRRKAYRLMFEKWLQWVGRARGHAPNQDMADLVGAYIINRCYQLLGETAVTSPIDLRKMEEEIIGEKIPSILFEEKRTWGYKKWFTPKGLTMEGRTTSYGSGYDAGYSFLTLAYAGLYAELSKKNLAKRRLGLLVEALQYFIDPAELDKGICLNYGVETETSRRHPMPRGWHSGLNPGYFVYGAKLGLEPAKKILQIFLRNFKDEDLSTPDNPYYGIHKRSISLLFPYLDLLQEWNSRGIKKIDFENNNLPREIRTAYKLPMERKTTVWSDEIARHVVIKHKNKIMYIAFDWDSQSYLRKAKIHYYDGNNHWTGVLPEIYQEDLYIGRYGDFLVIMNSSSKERTVDLKKWKGGYILKDMVSKNTLTQDKIVISPHTTKVFLKER